MSNKTNSVIRERARGHKRDLGDGFMVRRVLPAAHQHAVGPFIFMDHLGPVVLAADSPLDVRPHPHIGLATVTYLWQGRVLHKDGLGNTQLVEPGDVNWMSAGSGIVHSERTAAEDRGKEQAMHGLQLWVALPEDKEQGDAWFEHTPADALPQLEFDGVKGRLVAGTAYGKQSSVTVSSDLFYVDAQVAQGKSLRLPPEHIQRAAYVIEGAMHVGEETIPAGQLISFESAKEIELVADVDTHVVLLGGAPLDGPRYIWWNLVASSKALLEQGRQDWREQRYPMVVGETEFIPLPDDQRATLRVDSGED